MKRILIGLAAWFAFCFGTLAYGQTGGGFPPPPFKKCPTSGGCTVQLAIGQSAAVVKTTSTSRTSATMTLDPDLNINCTNCNTIVYGGVFYYFITTAADGIKFQLTSGTCGSPASVTWANGEISNIATPSTVDVASNIASNTSGSSTSASSFQFYGSSFGITAPQGLAWCWSQVVAASTTFVDAGSVIWIQRTS